LVPIHRRLFFKIDRPETARCRCEGACGRAGVTKIANTSYVPVTLSRPEHNAPGEASKWQPVGRGRGCKARDRPALRHLPKTPLDYFFINLRRSAAAEFRLISGIYSPAAGGKLGAVPLASHPAGHRHGFCVPRPGAESDRLPCTASHLPAALLWVRFRHGTEIVVFVLA
jgi:hypothetical protein